MIRAMPHLPTEKLRVVGGRTDAEVEEIRGWAREVGVEDRVDVTGFVRHDTVFEHISGARVAVIASKGGSGSPMKAFEYMAVGLPIVATDVEGNREIIEATDAGILVEACNPESLAAGIKRVLNEDGLAEKLSANGLAYTQDHTWTRRAERLFAALEEIPPPRGR